MWQADAGGPEMGRASQVMVKHGPLLRKPGITQGWAWEEYHHAIFTGSSWKLILDVSLTIVAVGNHLTELDQQEKHLFLSLSGSSCNTEETTGEGRVINVVQFKAEKQTRTPNRKDWRESGQKEQSGRIFKLLHFRNKVVHRTEQEKIQLDSTKFCLRNHKVLIEVFSTCTKKTFQNKNVLCYPIRQLSVECGYGA